MDITLQAILKSLAQVRHRLDAVLFSSDADFEPLPVEREDWRAA